MKRAGDMEKHELIVEPRVKVDLSTGWSPDG